MKSLSLHAKRRIALLVFVLSPVGFGAYDLFAVDDAGQLASSYLISIIVGIGALLAWCSFDATIHDFEISTGLRFGIFLLAVVAVPVYLVKARGWTGALRIGLGLPILASSVGTYYLGWYGAFSIAEAVGYF